MVCYRSFTIFQKTGLHSPGKFHLMKKIIFFVFALISFSRAGAQFITKGVIEYERKTNQHALMDDNSMWDAAAKKSLPQFVSAYFDLRFDGNQTSYKPGREPDTRQNKFWGIFEYENQIATNLDSSTYTNSKSLQGATYLINDRVRKIDWKIAPDTRQIAGFECRKAVGRIMDSVVVIAFYTDEIIPAGGPESFTGLPGMILGIAIPRLHTTWYATKLQLLPVSANDLAAPKKGKKIAMDEFAKQVQATMKDWGPNANQLIMQMSL